MKGFTYEIRHTLLRLATTFATLLVGMTFALATSTAAASEVNKVVFEKPVVVEKVVLPFHKVVVPVEKFVVVPAEKQEVKVDSSSAVFERRFNPFFFRPFFFNPFFDEEFFGFEDFEE